MVETLRHGSSNLILSFDYYLGLEFPERPVESLAEERKFDQIYT